MGRGGRADADHEEGFQGFRADIFDDPEADPPAALAALFDGAGDDRLAGRTAATLAGLGRP